MANKYYLDQDGVRLLVQNFNDNLSAKVDKADMSAYATKAELNNVSVDLTGYATENYVNNQIANIPIYDDSELQSAVSALEGQMTGIYHYRGSVADLAALQAIENPENGDVYNLEDTGMNAAWNGTAWDDFGTIVDLSGYAKSEDIIAITRAELNSILFSGKTAVVSNAESFQAVLDNDQEEVEITLNDDVEVESPLIIPEGKKVTLKLDDNVMTAANRAITVNGGELIIEGGEIGSTSGRPLSVANGSLTVEGTDVVSTSDCAIEVFGENSELVINSGNVTAQEVPVLVTSGASATINGGHLTGLDNFAIGGNGTNGQGDINVTINGGTIEGKIQSNGYIAAAIYWPNSGTLTINGGTIISDGAGIVMRGGTVNLNEGTTVIANGATGVKGKVGDSRVVVGPYAVVYDANSKYPAMDTLELNIASDVVLQGTDGDIDTILAEGIEANINDARTPQI